MTKTHADEALRRARKTAFAALACVLLVTAVGAGAAFAFAGTFALWGALLGGGVGLVFSLPTALLALFARDKDGTGLAATVMISWLIKIVVVIVSLKLLDAADFFSRPWFGWVLLLSVICAAVADYLVLGRKQLPLDNRYS
ncbi:hypothetical protein ACUH95_05590 [Dermabacteraceae bacterium P13101]